MSLSLVSLSCFTQISTNFHTIAPENTGTPKGRGHQQPAFFSFQSDVTESTGLRVCPYPGGCFWGLGPEGAFFAPVIGVLVLPRSRGYVLYPCGGGGEIWQRRWASSRIWLHTSNPRSPQNHQDLRCCWTLDDSGGVPITLVWTAQYLRTQMRTNIELLCLLMLIICNAKRKKFKRKGRKICIWEK